MLSRKEKLMGERVMFIFLQKRLKEGRMDLAQTIAWQKKAEQVAREMVGLISDFEKSQAGLHRHAENIPGISTHIYSPIIDLWSEFALSVLDGSELRRPAELKRLVEYNIRLASRWTKWSVKEGPFTLKPVFLPHIESPFGLALMYKGERVATIGGFVDQREGGKALVLNNVQGMSGKGTPLRIFKELFQENWRVTLVKMATERAKKLGLHVEGEPPAGPTGQTTRKGYRNQLRQYRQTFTKAGLKEVEKPLASKFHKKLGKDRKWVLKRPITERRRRK
jgi:hypothetical protein